MILCGDPSRFAVKWEVTHPGETPLGHFAFVVMGEEVGDFSDTAYMIGCYNWTRDLVEGRRDRFEPGLFEMDKVEAFETLVHPVFALHHEVEPRPEIYPDISRRFHIQHLGMSSMDDFIVLFMKNEAGESRLIWRFLDEDIHEAHFAVDEVEKVFAELVARARSDMSKGLKVASLPDALPT